MDTFEQRLSETSQFYQDGDLNLGFRRLIDCALDTGNMDIFKSVLEFTDWRYNLSEEGAGSEEISKAIDLLEKINKAKAIYTDAPLKDIIKAEGISKKYKKGNFTLGPLDVSVSNSEMVGLVGENGNGKTTLLRLLGGELGLTSGTIEYNFPKSYKNQYELRTRLVYIPQRINRLRGSLMENLQFTLSQHEIHGEENELMALTLLARMGLWQYKKMDWGRLSSGYKMRFELARTLLRKPEVLLLDEPLANLDILAQQIILEDLRFLSGSLLNPFGVILSSQQLYEVEKVSDKIIFLNEGRLVNQSNKQEKEEEAGSLIIEFDANITRDQLKELFNQIGLEKLHFNGGNYIAYFPEGVNISEVMYLLGKEKVQVSYIRDISKSSRRFFID
ncbi:MAG: ABC transporter ATP-binding protein [Bacteroidales bacterium]|jgi:ABC-2 type transport system ATP-binding protein|nr:ABC transporter ATP-binding protein [Bacteroidales bacterium]